ncbi:MAG TPA: M13 family metallopeptidase [Vicinamibacteria bacterium]
MKLATWLLLVLVSLTGPPSGIDVDQLSTSVRPQDDFNAYVNGTWIRETSIPADKQTWGSFEVLIDESEKNQRAIVEELAGARSAKGTDEQRVGDFYRSYMDTAKIEELGSRPVQEALKEILAAPSAKALFDLGARSRIDGVDSPLSLQVFPDLGDSTRYMVYFSQSGLTLPDRDYYFEKGDKYDLLREALPGYAAKLFELSGVDDAEARGRAVLDLETRLAEPQWRAEETRNVQKIYNLIAKGDLEKKFAGIAWEPYLESSRLLGVEQVVVAQPSYVEALGKLLSEIPLADWKSYFAFRVLDASAPYLSDAFVQARFDFSGRLVGGLEEIPPRWQRGVRNVNALMGEAVGKLYVARHFPPEAKARMEALVTNLIDTYGEAIEELPWMTAETKARAQEKRKKFTYKIGYPETFRDYSKLEIDPSDLVGNVTRGNQFEYQRNIDKLGTPIDRTEWQLTPQTVNAYHDPTKNEIVFPAAILQPPFFNMAADDAVNYGAIGVVIGHEMGHAFDDQGRQFDGDGNLRDWWSEYDAAAYEESASSLVKQFDTFEALPGLHVNGKLTLGENIGDLTGITIAYRAYLRSLGGKEAPVIDGFSGAQRFFIGYAQVWRSKYREEAMRQLVISNPHAPPEFRVTGPLRNSPEFLSAFGVKPGDGMWLPPEERVKIW